MTSARFAVRWLGRATLRFRLGFGGRLALTLALTLALVGVVGYAAISSQLEQRLITAQAAEHHADARSLEVDASVASGRIEARAKMAPLIAAIARRPEIVNVLLVDERYRIVEPRDGGAAGSRVRGSEVVAALERGRSYAGRETDPTADRDDLELVVPVEVAGQRYAFKTTRDHRFLDAELRDVRQTIALLGLLALLGGGGAFYLFGGRALLRDHRIARDRATRDGLTDLGNQRAFEQELSHAVALAQRHGEALAVAAIDLDDFKFINDRQGHAHGDQLLRRVASALLAGRTGDRGFRVGGDEFMLLLPRTDIDGAVMVARRLHRACADQDVSVSVGISSLRPGHDAAGVREEADAAMYEVKRRGGNDVVKFDDIRQLVSITSPEKLHAVRALLDGGQIGVALQPIWNLRSGSLLGVEALARPVGQPALSGPAEAFDVAEQLGRVRELDMLCVRAVLARAADLPPDALLFVNIAPQTLDLDVHRNDWLLQAAVDAGVDPRRIVIEVTERFGGRMNSVLKGLESLRSAGFKLALDDVGTGNSGLEMLRRVRLEYIKLDRSVVVDAMTSTAARGVLLAMATFAAQTDVEVIAEGIEDEDVLSFVRRLDGADDTVAVNVSGVQGYGLGRPAEAMPDPEGAPLRTHFPDASVASRAT